MNNFWETYTEKLQYFVNMYAIWSLSYAVFHVLQIKWGLKEPGCVFGSIGVEGFVTYILISLIIAPFIFMYTHKKS